ncbi:hypothetical protein IRT44_13075 [Anoxybacillus sediminis]|jgi:hypothetical protein|nr:hypothetical protein [Brevibacillus sp. NL20B1]NNV03566.1 hypothetical protein [Brevibacillus sp. MCWH]REK61528.1 MAG: hypothetical protein DF221_16140 [Brevibacillus sp.]UFJ63108.1 hypothetical protein IRT44_13075 [Anoxybacillus sediminis]
MIEQAEQVWSRVMSSPRRKVIYTVNGVDYTPLPDRFNTRRKIARYFRRYWGKRLTRVMVCNLNLRLVKGKLCVPAGDVPLFPTMVQSLRIVRNRPNQKVVRAVLTGGATRVCIDYRFVRTGPSSPFSIAKRTARQFDIRYRSCSAKPAAAAEPFIIPAAKPTAQPAAKRNAVRKKRKLLKTP